MRLMIRNAFILALLLSSVGCQNRNDHEEEIFNRLAKLEKEVENHNSSLLFLDKAVMTINQKLVIAEYQRKQFSSVSFDPAASEGFGVLDAGIARLAVMLVDVKPQADGVRVEFDVGNPTSALISDITYEVKYGARGPEFDEENPASYDSRNELWQKSLQSKSISSAGDIKPGAWTRVTLALPNIKSESVGYIELSLTAKQIALSKPQVR